MSRASAFVMKPGPEKAPRLTHQEAMAYVRKVKARFNDEKDTYEEFLEVLRCFRAQRTSVAGVIERVKELFKDHHDLLMEFNAFLPEGNRVQLSRVVSRL